MHRVFYAEGGMDDRDRAIAQSHIDLEERVRRRAYEIYQSHHDGNGQGETALDD